MDLGCGTLVLVLTALSLRALLLASPICRSSKMPGPISGSITDCCMTSPSYLLSVCLSGLLGLGGLANSNICKVLRVVMPCTEESRMNQCGNLYPQRSGRPCLGAKPKLHSSTLERDVEWAAHLWIDTLLPFSEFHSGQAKSLILFCYRLEE